MMQDKLKVGVMQNWRRTMSELIYDRTQADVTNGTFKGYYNTSDLNRVESWCRYLADELNAVGYSISITTKTNWTSSDLRSASQMERIRTNIKALMTGFHYITTIYSNANNFDYKKANNWEKILNEIFYMLWGMENWYVYSGVSNSGQNRLWQHRFRQYFEVPEIVTYTFYSFIQSSGTQYINTGVQPNSSTIIDIDFKLLGSISIDYERILGSSNGSYAYLKLQRSNTSTTWAYSLDNTAQANVTLNQSTDYELQLTNHSITVNNTTTDFSSVDYNSNYDLYLFHDNNRNGIFRLYSCKIYQEGELVRDFIPAIRSTDNAVGLFDNATGVFYENAGTGAFSVTEDNYLLTENGEVLTTENGEELETTIGMYTDESGNQIITENGNEWEVE